MTVNASATYTDPALDAQIEAAEDACYQARSAATRLVEQRLAARLRTIFPAGGVLHARTEADVDGTHLHISKVTDADGTEYHSPDFDVTYGEDMEELLGQEHYDAIMADLNTVHYYGGLGQMRYKYGEADLVF